MTTHPDTATALAAELTGTGFFTGTISSPVKNSQTTHAPEVFQADVPPAALAAYSKKIRLRRLTDRVEHRIQAEFFIAQKTFHRNMSEQETTTLLDTCFSGLFTRGTFSGTDGVRSVMVNKKGTISVVFTAERTISAPGTGSFAITGLVPDTGELFHDRIKQRLIPEGVPVPYLIDLGVMAADGTVHKSKYPKYRQINRFLEFVADVLPQLRDAARRKAGKPLRIVDFGCGKSYLTFALYHYLHHMEKIPVSITGLDLKQDVIDHCSILARTYGYDGLSFAVGDIAGYSASATIDMVVSLHACDTATDLALAQAVRWNAPVIFAVPCCQHELNTQLAAGSAHTESAKPLVPLLRHGLIRERFAALLTDTLRAELLESCGYQVQLVEFIDMSHTPKNILIRAVRGKDAGETTPAAYKPSRSFRELAGLFGVTPSLEQELHDTETGGTTAGKD